VSLVRVAPESDEFKAVAQKFVGGDAVDRLIAGYEWGSKASLRYGKLWSLMIAGRSCSSFASALPGTLRSVFRIQHPLLVERQVAVDLLAERPLAI
jgi:hypothetical protein